MKSLAMVSGYSLSMGLIGFSHQQECSLTMRHNYTLRGRASVAISYPAIVLGEPLNVNGKPSPVPIAARCVLSLCPA